MRPRRLRRLVPGAARSGRIPAGVAVRGLVPVASAHRCRHRAHDRGRACGVCGDRMSEAFVAELRRQGGALAELAAAPTTPSSEPGPPQLAASGPRAAGREQDYELLLEMIHEGSR